MTKLQVITREGQSISVEAAEDQSVMEAIRDNGVDELQALCGGQLSCATCHVYVEPEVGAFLPAMSEYEDELLDSSDYRKDESRLSCQIFCLPNIDGATITIAPEN